MTMHRSEPVRPGSLTLFAAPEVLPGDFGVPPGEAQEIRPEVLTLVRAQGRALLNESPGFRALPAPRRHDLAHDLVKVAAYSASLLHDDWHQARKLGQTPLVRERMSQGTRWGDE